jgi:hypothetical protein
VWLIEVGPLPLAGFDLQGQHVVGVAPSPAIELHDHLAHLIALEAVVDVVAAEAGAEGVHHGAEIHAEGGHLQAIRHQLHQGGSGGEAGGHPLKAVGGPGGADEGLGLLFEVGEAQLAVAAVE